MLEWLQALLGDGYTEEVAEQAAEALRAAQEAVLTNCEAVHRQALAEREQAYGDEIRRLKLEHAVDAVLLEAGARNRRAAKALIDFEAMTVSEGGKIEGLAEQINALKESDGYLFAEKQQSPPLVGYCPAEGMAALGKGSKEMGYEELCTWFSEGKTVQSS